MAMDYWEPTEMEQASMSIDQLWKRGLTPLLCSKCGGSHRTIDCGTQRWDRRREADENVSMEELFRRSIRAPLICGKCGDPHQTTTCTNVKKAKTGEPTENWTMKELEEYYSSSRIACKFCGDAHGSQTCQLRDPQHFSWSNNGSYQNAHNPYVYKEELFGLSPPSPEIHNYFEEDEEYISREDFEELKESAKGIEVAIGQLVKLVECQPQESMFSQRDECPNESKINIHTKDEEDEKFVEETSEEEDTAWDPEVLTCVDPILTIVESKPDIMIKKKPLVQLDEQGEELIEVDFVVEFLPEKYLKTKRQREIEFVLKIQDDRINKRSRKEEATSEGSSPHKESRALRGGLGYILEIEPGAVKEHDPDTIPFDPGG